MKISIGICAMEKKINSKHMQNILKEIEKFSEFEIIIFTNNIIFNKEVQDWPIVKSMIIFFSNGFPYEKGLNYVKLRKPFLINDFENQKLFWDRRVVFKILEENKLPIPKYFILNRGETINNDFNKISKQNLKDTDNEIQHMINKYANTKLVSNNYYNNSSCYHSEETCNNFNFGDKKCFLNETNKNFEDNFKEKMHYDYEGNKVIEHEDHLEYLNDKEMKTIKINKPFVEKPCNGDDHRVFIYYPPSLGGGGKRLFRKTKNLSSLYIPYLNNIREDNKSYMYEEFLQTDGFDIKVYTIGPEYAHAEARKSPALDGVVRRTPDGKEIRYPINLTQFEKELAKKIVEIFKQNVCGFDILRSKGKSYICDVNGWSFVKSNKQYYSDCSLILRKMILCAIDSKLYYTNDNKLLSFCKQPINLLPQYDGMQLPHRPYKNISIAKDGTLDNDENNTQEAEELRSVVCVFRHADRSPKQKMKVIIEDKNILNLFSIYGDIKKKIKNLLNIIEKNNYSKYNTEDLGKVEEEIIKKLKELKLKKPKELDHIFMIVSQIINDYEINKIDLCKTKSYATNNINNDLKLSSNRTNKKENSNASSKLLNNTCNLKMTDRNFIDKMKQLKMILETNRNFMGMTRKIQLKPLKIRINFINNSNIIESIEVTKSLLIFKWGGDLTHSGIRQAKLLGNTFRKQVYPAYQNKEEDGLLRLHSTYRHDLKVYSSDEGRCMKSGAAFLQGLLQLDGSIIPIIFSMIRKDDPVLNILDDCNKEVAEMKKEIKNNLSDMLHYNGLLSDKYKEFILKQEKNDKNSSNKIHNSYHIDESRRSTCKSKSKININSSDSIYNLNKHINNKDLNFSRNNSQLESNLLDSPIKYFDKIKKNSYYKDSYKLLDEYTPNYIKSTNKRISRDSSLESLIGKEIGKNYDKYLFKVMEHIKNPLEELYSIYYLISDLLSYIKSMLSEEELVDTDTYFIKRINNLLKRKCSIDENFEITKNYVDYNNNKCKRSKTFDKLCISKKNKEKDFKENILSNCNSIKIEISKDIDKNDKKAMYIEDKNLTCNNINSIKNNNTNILSIKNDNEDSFSNKLKIDDPNSFNNINNFVNNFNNEVEECESEKLILIFKRWIKLYQDFYDTKTKKFDISKIPDIYDNIKYDLIHNTFLRNNKTKKLFEKSLYIAEFLMVQEYGITIENKIELGMKIINPLLDKIFNDLLWWINKNDNNNTNNNVELTNENKYNCNYSSKNINLLNNNKDIKECNINDKIFKNNSNKNTGFEKENENFSGLDRNKLSNEIRSAWRHVKTRYYFTSASHLYSLINVVCYGLDSHLLEKTDTNFISELKKNRLELDYCSHLMFRLYENLNANEHDPERFRLEIIMSPGSNKSPYESDNNHMIGVSPWIILNKNLTLNQMIEFFNKLNINIEKN